MYSIVAFFCGVIVTLLLSTSYAKLIFRQCRRIFVAALLNAIVKKYNYIADEHKKRLFAPLMKDFSDGKCTMLEIGAGTGANFKYYPSGTSIICLEPIDKCESYLRKNIVELGNGLILKEFLVGFAEDMTGIESGSVDVVVSTLVLCSVRDVEQSLKEVLRVLKPGGKFYFLEHVVHDEGHPWYNAQRRFAPIQLCLAECRLLQKTHALIDAAGFSHVEHKEFEMTELRKLTPRILAIWMNVLSSHTVGVATK